MSGTQRLCLGLAIAVVCWCSLLGLSAVSASKKNHTVFEAVWNSLCESCPKRFGVYLDVYQTGITENTGGVWYGDHMVIYYPDKLGLYPFVSDKTEESINGGLPQLADFDAHYAKMEEDIKKTIPDENFSGNAVIDWESWRPIWDTNWGWKKIYKAMSKDLVRKDNPDMSADKVEATAKLQFENASRALMEGTLLKARELRPKGKWGYYGFPRCYNDKGGKTCSQLTMDQNDQLDWLFKASDVISPCAYIVAQSVPSDYVYGQVQESLRVRRNIGEPHKPIMPYIRYNIKDTIYYDKALMEATLQVPADSGVEGVIIWGSNRNANTEEKCRTLRKYMHEEYGPYIKTVFEKAEKCSALSCNGKGRCYKKIADGVNQVSRDVSPSEAGCYCYKGWTGTSCDVSVTS